MLEELLNMVTVRFIRKDTVINGRAYWKQGCPKKIQKALKWEDTQDGLFEWQADAVNGRVILVRVPIGDTPQ